MSARAKPEVKKATRTKKSNRKPSPDPDLLTVGVMLEAALALCNDAIGAGDQTHTFTALVAMLEKADRALTDVEEGETA